MYLSLLLYIAKWMATGIIFLKNMISFRISQLSPSPTLVLDAKVKEMQRSGMPVINLGIGEPDFETPPNIKRAAIKAIRDGFTHYTETAGILELRKEIAEKFERENHVLYDPSEIVVGCGSKHLLYSVFQVLCKERDEVLVPVPTWSTYIKQIKLAGGKPKLIKLFPPFKLTAKDIIKNVSSHTQIILINSPANPTGAMIDDEELDKIAHLAVKHKLWVVSDEIYEKITYGKKHISIASLNKKIKERIITINGFSKAYAMTGWRVGYAAGPKEVISAMGSLQSQMTSNTSSISQMAALEAISGKQDPVEKMRREFWKRSDFVLSLLCKIEGLSFVRPEGAFYFFVSLNQLFGKGFKTSRDWCEALLGKEQVAVVPGEAFLYPGYFRLSFACSLKDLSEGIVRISRFVKKYV